MILVELANANPKGPLDISSEQERAADLVSESRLYRQTADHTREPGGSQRSRRFWIACWWRSRMPLPHLTGRARKVAPEAGSEGILFKIRVLGSNVRNQEEPAASTVRQKFISKRKNMIDSRTFIPISCLLITGAFAMAQTPAVPPAAPAPPAPAYATPAARPAPAPRAIIAPLDAYDQDRIREMAEGRARPGAGGDRRRPPIQLDRDTLDRIRDQAQAARDQAQEMRDQSQAMRDAYRVQLEAPMAPVGRGVGIGIGAGVGGGVNFAYNYNYNVNNT